jgi:prophage antirepressor-like protein
MVRGAGAGCEALGRKREKGRMSTEIVTKEYMFENLAVRIGMFNDEPWWVAKDVAVALGYAESSIANAIGSLVAKVPEEWRGQKRFLVDGNTLDMIALSEQGLYFFLARSNMPAALPFQKWIAGEVLPSIRKTGSYGIQTKPPTPTQMFLLQAQAMAAQEERQTVLEVQQDVLKTEQKVLVTRVDTIENKQQRARQTLLNLLPPGVGEDIEGETRDSLLIEKLHRIVNAHADETYASYESVWKDLYKRFDFRKHARIYRRLEHRVKGETILSIIEKEGGLPQLYALAWEAYAPEEAKVKHRKNLLKSKSN